MGVRIGGTTRAYWREIFAVLAAKIVALLLLFFCFFATPPSVPAPGIHIFGERTSR